eukprot:TRINITY_DN43806_c0_g1_i1.p1 TRINITY_DN43806_c0_g1~~TRINITY_DN43806_c0_g1_i1.p1  ORF type:complete len:887 (-),score=181.16 TRINITY_DN43806_c0_g1_i1:85-2571(-)
MELASVAEDSDSLKPMELELQKEERIWWSEPTMVEVKKLERALKQEFHKTAASIREQFKRQIDIELSEQQQNVASLERSISRLREDIDVFKARQDASNPVRQISDNLSQVESALRMELDDMRCSIEKCQRQQAATRLQQSLQPSAASLREEIVALSDRLTQTEGQTLMAVVEATNRTAGASLNALQASTDAAIADERSARMKEFEKLWDETSRLSTEVAEERLARMQALASASAQEGSGAAMAVDVDMQLQAMRKAMELQAAQVRELKAELEKAGEENCKHKVSKLSQDSLSSIATTEGLQSQVCGPQPSSSNAEVEMRLLEIRKALELESASRAMQIQGLAISVETERLSRRAASDHYQAAIDDIRNILEEVLKLRVYLVEPALNMRPSIDESAANGNKDPMKAIASPQMTLSDDSAIEQAALETSAGVMNVSSFGITDRQIAEWSNKLTASQLELREELDSRVDMAVASIRGDLAAQAAELRGEIAASQTELRGDFAKCRGELAGSQTSAVDGGGPVLQPDTVLVSHLKEFASFIEILASGTGRLSEQFWAESKDRRQAEVQINARFSRVERRLAEIGAGEEELQEEVLLHDSAHHAQPDDAVAGQANEELPERSRHQPKNYSNVLRQRSSVNQELKESLEQLVNRLTKMLGKKADSGARDRSLSVVSAFGAQSSLPPRRASLPRSPPLTRRSMLPQSPPLPQRSTLPPRTSASPSMPQGRAVRTEVVPEQPTLVRGLAASASALVTPRQCNRPCNHLQSLQLAGTLSQHAQSQGDLRGIPKAHGQLSPRVQAHAMYFPAFSVPGKSSPATPQRTGATPAVVLNWR